MEGGGAGAAWDGGAAVAAAAAAPCSSCARSASISALSLPTSVICSFLRAFSWMACGHGDEEVSREERQGTEKQKEQTQEQEQGQEQEQEQEQGA